MFKKTLLAATFASLRAGDGESIQMSYSAESEIPAAHKGLYTESNGVWNLTGVVGIKTQDDVNNVMNALTKERNDNKALRTKYAALGDRDVSEILADIDRIPALEAAAKGKGSEDIEAQVAARVEQATAPLKRDIQTLTTERDGLTTQVNDFQQANNRRTIGDSIREAGTKAKILPEAMNDVIALGLGNFELNEAGAVIAKADINGLTPGVAPEVWLTEMKRSKPYFFPPVKGANAGGGNGNGGGSNPFSKEGWNMTEQGKMVKEDRALAEQMAASAGTTIGGRQPE